MEEAFLVFTHTWTQTQTYKRPVKYQSDLRGHAEDGATESVYITEELLYIQHPESDERQRHCKTVLYYK